MTEHSAHPAAMTTLRLLDDSPPPQPDKSRPAVKRLLQGDGANLIAFTFSAGQSLPDHRAAHPITVQCLSGVLDFGCAGETVRLEPGVITHLPAGLTHRVDCPAGASGPAVLLLTMLTGETHSS